MKMLHHYIWYGKLNEDFLFLFEQIHNMPLNV